MITDNELWFADAQAETTQATHISTNVYDRLNANGDLGVGLRRGYIEIRINAAVTSAGAATVQWDIIQADNAAMSTNKEVLASTDAIGKATLVAGYKVRIPIPDGITRRYLAVQDTVGAAALTGGSWDIYYVDVPDGADQTYFGNNG